MRSRLNESTFITNVNPSSAYLLGFLWGDGYFYEKVKTIRLEILKSDLDTISPIINNTGIWTYYYRHRKNRQPQGGITVLNRTLFDFLCSKHYDKKSYFSHQLAIEHIPEKLRHFWLRGYFDADGCVYINKKNYCYQASFCGSYEQDWGYFQRLLQTFHINAHHQLSIVGNNKSSMIRLTGRKHILKLFQMIYPNDYDFGLKRKFDKFNEANQY